jgi:hypothetical protein
MTARAAAGAALTLAAGRWLLRLTPIGPAPAAPDRGGPDGLRLAVLVHASPFVGTVVTEAAPAELRALRGRLAELHAAAEQAAAGPVRQTFALRAGTLRLDLALAPPGVLTVAVELRADPAGPTALRTAAEADPSALPEWVAALDAVLAAAPPAPRAA